MLQDVSPKTVFVMIAPDGLRSVVMGLASFPLGADAPEGAPEDTEQLVYHAAADFHAQHLLVGRTVRSEPDHVVFRPWGHGADGPRTFEKLTVERLRELTDTEVIGRLALLRDFDGPDEDEALQIYYRSRFLPESYLARLREVAAAGGHL